MAKKGRGLLMVWTDVPADKEAEFNKWYNEEHLPERMAVPGFLSGARYEAVSGGPKHLAYYELESADVLKSEAYLKISNNPTEWTKRIGPATIGTNYIRNVYELFFPDKVTPEVANSPMAPALQIGRMGIPADKEDEWNEWYNTIYVPNYETVDGVIRGRRYRAIEGHPQYMTLYEFQNPQVSSGEEWNRVRDADPRNHVVRPWMLHEPGSPGVWTKTVELKS
jgi:hypothetical protein